MANELPDYEALRAIPDRHNPGRSAYREGETLYAQVVEDWDLEIGADVRALRPEQMAPPAGNASRAEWATYALAQGRDPEDVDGMTRDQLRAEFAGDVEPDSTAEGDEPAKGE